jgi:KRAB domain-containing zinc finger protein
MNAHTGVWPLWCDVCSKSFHQETNLKEINVNTVGWNHIHVMCVISHSLWSRILRDLFIHSGVRPFLCNACNKSFTTKISLKTHQRVHNWMQPFWCDVCNKAFTAKQNLERHQLIHSGLRPFSYAVCNELFHQKRRQSIHNAVPPFSCDVCNKQGPDFDDLKISEKWSIKWPKNI